MHTMPLTVSTLSHITSLFRGNIRLFKNDFLTTNLRDLLTDCKLWFVIFYSDILYAGVKKELIVAILAKQTWRDWKGGNKHD